MGRGRPTLRPHAAAVSGVAVHATAVSGVAVLVAAVSGVAVHAAAAFTVPAASSVVSDVEAPDVVSGVVVPVGVSQYFSTAVSGVAVFCCISDVALSAAYSKLAVLGVVSNVDVFCC